MKNKATLLSALAVALLYGCASTPIESQNTPVPPPASAPGGGTSPSPTATPLPETGVQGNPLKDPNNILSKRSVYYELDKYEITDQYRPIVQAHGRYLAEHRGTKMLVQGNCDERGSREYNIALGQRRADGVKRMLTLFGASDSQVESVSLGEEKPRCEEHTEACWAQNRRSDMLYGGEY
jgi:peptidoglycan-associated lipoprotein